MVTWKRFLTALGIVLVLVVYAAPLWVWDKDQAVNQPPTIRGEGR